MKGRRYDDVAQPSEPHAVMDPGGYRRTKLGGRWVWECTTPNGIRGNLALHEVVEHEDGTITVSPSILCDYPPDGPQWHGYLERGVWREC